ncbi:ABC transporter ATP-binding protein [Solirubrobacter ginsenosidimutans]|uniref:ABC transporter ATP-binding protein n=1 Tax=Solirubrobacter ginsenosidimutans TaxID=490573 RepID=A0A9X3MXT9_9ACTN|nr:ABC transporter ATP-binding protein [Solirubrobacter ginsenosidimutans]MDA0164755.1 ABC transporter ATP-binding protein [Solirubrobacter ginsenosidimutans]
MSSETPVLDEVSAVRARGLSKSYELGELASLKRTLRSITRLGRAQPPVERFHALRDVSFDIARGEAFTILGHNGSGKTTMMSILAAITPPSDGWLDVRGRVVPVLSVGSSFHPDLTGEENAVLFGTILGLDGDEIAEAMPGIAEFAEMDADHMETPVKRFSEGMKARLTFATALRFPADVYIFDEVLTFADDHFKATCVDEMRRLVREGRTVIFVSHELDLVRDICTRGLWLDRGEVRLLGEIEEVAGEYAAARARHERAIAT